MHALFALAVGCVAAAAPATAGAMAPGVSADTTPRAIVLVSLSDSSGQRRFDIPAEPLADALSDFSRQAGVRVTAAGAGLRGVRSAPVVGTFAPSEALQRLLAGTGFSGRFVDAQTVAVRPEGAADSVAALTRVVVTATTTRRPGYAAARTTSATKTDTPLRDTPQAVTVVTHELIADQAMQGMADLVRYVPGITMGQGEGHRDAPTIRGNSSTADFFVDGVRDDAQYYRDLYNVERVEALKGSNAMIFGRGGGGGVINRVLKDAQWAPTRELTLQGGSFEQRRAAVDVGQGFGRALAARLNGMYERSNAFRHYSDVERFGINPTLAVAAGARTTIRLGYEHFRDDRTVDRGIPSFRGRPSPAAISTFFGDPRANTSSVNVDMGAATVEHGTAGGILLRNRTQIAQYDKYYQNVYPSGVDASGTKAILAAYNNRHDRGNVFSQTDVTFGATTGVVTHTLLAGAEVGHQTTDNFRNTGFFGPNVMVDTVPFDAPTVAAPVTFSHSGSDANNRVTADVAAGYVQDQIALSQHVQAILGLRYDRFRLRFHNRNGGGQTLTRDDDMLSPRAGLVIKPVEPLSFYGGYSVSHLPSAGDQFSSLSATTQTLEPERFTNLEVGAKWEPLENFALTTAVYRLDRTNSSAPDPANNKRLVQTGRQRTTGWELGALGNLTPAWQLAGGVATQRARITSTTSAASAGATVPLVPQTTLSLWNKYQLARALGAGLGVIHQTRMYAAIDNSVTLPAFTRADAAVFLTLTPRLRAQANVENLFDTRYYATSHGNNNIMPGAPRLVRVSVVTGF